MTKTSHLRWATSADYDALGEVMYDAVRNGPSRYDEAQKAAWVPELRTGPNWTDRLATQEVIIGEQNGHITGFMSLADRGYVDFAFIRPEAQGTGLFRRLYNEIEAQARAQGEVRLSTHASLMAQPAFSAMGFKIIAPETVQIGSHSFKRFEMEKPL